MTGRSKVMAMVYHLPGRVRVRKASICLGRLLGHLGSEALEYFNNVLFVEGHVSSYRVGTLVPSMFYTNWNP